MRTDEINYRDKIKYRLKVRFNDGSESEGVLWSNDILDALKMGCLKIKDGRLVLLEEVEGANKMKELTLKEVFGEFRVEPWEDGEYIITCKLGHIGPSILKRDSIWLSDWLNAMVEDADQRMEEEEFE